MVHTAVFWKILHGLQSLGLVKVPVAKLWETWMHLEVLNLYVASKAGLQLVVSSNKALGIDQRCRVPRLKQLPGFSPTGRPLRMKSFR